MEQGLARGKQIQDDCAAVIKKLRAILHSTEEQLRMHKKQTMFLTQLVAKTLPKGLHCLLLRLSTEYYSLNSDQQSFPIKKNLRIHVCSTMHCSQIIYWLQQWLCFSC
ncbi:hypothetical protein MKW94_015984 [Papaver nudicaule]|uniref:Uncharacterized protein n=1 Tax=Papaver nudicaule TaxID=74823 RepID=A0AA41VY39_PAPNU|nr:hypothetical protein [Papaver nudicaule]